VKITNRLKLLLSLFIFAASLALGFQIISISNANQIDKKDYAELAHIKYGLFSVNKWKEQVALIVFNEITKLNLTKANEKLLKQHVEVQLERLIDQVEKRIKKNNQGTAKGWVKQSFIEAFVDMKDIKKGIPEYADAIIIEMTKTKTEQDMKNILKKRIQGYLNTTFQNQNLLKVDEILKKSASTDMDSAKILLDNKIQAHQKILNRLTAALVALMIVLFVIGGFSKAPLLSGQYFLMLLSLTVCLLVGVTVPMIDLEAKISEMKFYLLDHPITFVNQVLYFQSKSILDVFWIMFNNEGFAMKLVGVMIVSFSIIIPVLKLLSSVVYYLNFRQARNNRWIQFFVLKSGKWSMADVLVVSIFMAYIGFNGIVSSQLGNFSSADQELIILSTNGTSLQPGFFIFLSYAILSLFFSSFLTRTISPQVQAK
jgi:hypothetical protein